LSAITVKVVILGIIQGLTEFLPISSSGHLVLSQQLFGMKEPELLLNISLHLGTLAAVCIVFYKEIRAILIALMQFPRLFKQNGGLKNLLSGNEQYRLVLMILIGSIPTAILGLLFHSIADQIFNSVEIVGCMLLVTGTFLWMTRHVALGGLNINKMKAKDAIRVGIAQGLAIMPGISRSGATISTALYLGIDRELAGRYSFLLSIPAIGGALLLELDSSLAVSSVPLATILVGVLTAGATGWVALILLLRLVKRGKLYLFAPYCWLVGVAALVLSIL
jgi:undecaprenyl-diphosphatase